MKIYDYMTHLHEGTVIKIAFIPFRDLVTVPNAGRRDTAARI